MQSSRRIFFNPTSIPSLRTKAPRRDFYNGAVRPRVGGKGNVWRLLRRESTETGEDQSGHIAAAKNEGILFFDSMNLQFLVLTPLIVNRPLPAEAQLGSSIAMACRPKPP